MTVCTVAGCFATLKTTTEDEMMKKQFGEEWVAWSSKVKYRMIPGVF
jgi:protein-S-isoprenylcysteine O-methyltransferase Ste14